MKKSYTTLLLSIALFIIIGTYTIFSSNLITTYMSVWLGMMISLILALTFGIFTFVYRKKRYKHSIFIALTTIWIFTTIGLLQQYLNSYFTTRLGVWLFSIIGFIVVFGLIMVGDVSMSKIINKAL
jgi:hypothetical protein